MIPFVETHYIKNESQDFENADFVLPYAAPRETDIIQVDDMNIPPGQLAINRGTGVEAADGWVGRVEEFLVSPDSGNITHLVVRQAHWSGKRELTLPVSTVDRVFDNVVYLKLDKKGVAALPTIPAARSWGFPGSNIELVALVFDGTDKAGEVVKFIKKMRQEHTIARIRNFAVLQTDADGKPSLSEDKDVDKRQGTIFGAISGGLIGLLAGPVGAIVGAAAGAATGRVAADRIDMGFSNDYLQGLQEHLKPNSSAVLAVVEHQWVGSVTDALKDFGGTVFTQALPDEIAAQLLPESGSDE
ncbi:MAG: DUF1269 domain-containing protein [Chloroflexi bacterium]|nr:MAG: DUF1269 domain-containing protein [Chloroflexota bacterium]